MLCDHCREREAVVTITMVTNGASRTHHLCPECANQFRLDENNENSELSRTIFRILSETMAGKNPAKGPNAEESEKALSCPVCGKTFPEWKEDGQFGCQNCVRAFAEALNGTLLSIQGTDSYAGPAPEKGKVKRSAKAVKAPGKEPEKELLTELKNQLDSAVLLEDYQKAAALRDRIAALTDAKEKRDE